MLFNSIDFLVFLPVVFLLYWFVFNKNLRFQNMLLLAASYFFYGCWDWRFVFLLAFSTFLDYFTGVRIYHATSQKQKKFWLSLSVLLNLGFLGFFKYYNFFIDSSAQVLNSFGFNPQYALLNIILPLGISFYTFHGLSYVFDIYNNKIKPTTNGIDYALFVSFFPLLVAGPIERATHLLPQIKRPRTFSYTQAADGMRQILWGLFKKMVIADGCAMYANNIFNNPAAYPGSSLALSAVFFAFQIYGDFSGYSDIALGTARLFGIELLQNFRYPYFSRSIAEFWRRWHISLSSWFKDYLYIPLGGSRGNKWSRVRNTFIIFLVSGFWHGANFTFIAWGFLNALYIMPSIIFKTNRRNLDVVAGGRYLPKLGEFFQILLTFSLTVFAWIFFRAENMTHAFQYIGRLFSSSILHMPNAGSYSNTLIALLVLFVLVEWFGREANYAIEKLAMVRFRLVRWSVYAMVVFLIGMFMQTSGTPFIYFQF